MSKMESLSSEEEEDEVAKEEESGEVDSKTDDARSDGEQTQTVEAVQPPLIRHILQPPEIPEALATLEKHGVYRLESDENIVRRKSSNVISEESRKPSGTSMKSSRSRKSMKQVKIEETLPIQIRSTHHEKTTEDKQNELLAATPLEDNNQNQNDRPQIVDEGPIISTIQMSQESPPKSPLQLVEEESQPRSTVETFEEEILRKSTIQIAEQEILRKSAVQMVEHEIPPRSTVQTVEQGTLQKSAVQSVEPEILRKSAVQLVENEIPPRSTVQMVEHENSLRSIIQTVQEESPQVAPVDQISQAVANAVKQEKVYSKKNKSIGSWMRKKFAKSSLVRPSSGRRSKSKNRTS